MTKAVAVERTPQTEPMSELGERIDRRRAIRERLGDARTALSDTLRRRVRLGQETLEVTSAVAGLKAGVEGTDSPTPAAVFELKRKQDQLNLLRLELGKANARIRGLEKEIRELEAAELSLNQSQVSLKEFIKHQESVDVARAAVLEIEKAIRAQEREIELAVTAMPIPSSLHQQREDLLSEIALGRASKSALDALDAKIKAEEENAAKAMRDASQRANTSRHALVGLQRKLAIAQKELRRLEEQRPEALAQYVFTEAEVACAQYVKAALVLKEHYLQILALEEIIKRHVGVPLTLSTDSVHRLFIPPFNLSQCAALGEPGAVTQAAIERAFDIERNRLERLGVRFERQKEEDGE